MTTTLRPFTFDRGIYFHRPPTYDESVRTLFRGAGWIWHPKQPNDCCARRQGTACKACELEKFGVWFTTDASRAVLLIEHATAPARAALQGFLTTLEESTAASAEIDIPVPVGMVPYPYQKAGVAFMLRRDRSLLADQMGLGKQQPVDTPVLTPSGWVPIGSLKVGDAVVGSNGKSTAVTGVFPQGVMPNYRVTFSDGSSTEAGAEHLWAFDHRVGGKRWERIVLTTAQLAGKEPVVRKHPNGRTTTLDVAKTPLYLPMLSSPVEYATATADLPIPPYTMGQLIANGHLSGNSTVLTPNPDDVRHILDKLSGENIRVGAHRQYGSSVHIGLPGLRAQIRALGIDVRSADKFIPAPYMTAKPSERVALLHGLMDGDGSISATRNKVTYHTTSQRLASDVRALVESIGGIASVRMYERAHQDKPAEYQVRIRLPAGIAPFSTPRKLDRFSPGTHAHPCRTLVSVTPSRVVDSVCIAVDAPDRLYVTEHCILTHNTSQAIMFLNVRQDVSRVLIVAPKTLGANWEREIHRWLVRDTFRVYVGEIPSTIDVPESRTLVSIVGVEQCRDSEVQASAARFLRSGTSCLIGDEMHRTKNARARQTRAILGDVREPDPAKQGGIQSHAKYVLLLTGTPIVNGRPIEMWPLLRTCDPTTWTSWRTFYRRYCGGSPTGAAYLEELATKARSSCMIRRLKRDVLPDLPPKTRQVVPIINDEIAELVRQEQLLLKGVVPNVPGAEEEAAYLDNLKSLRDIGPVDITEMSALRKQLAVAKVPLVAEFAEETLESADKVAIYAHHQDVIRDLERRLAAFNPAVISGTTPHDKRMAAVDLFQSDPSCRVFIGSIQAAGVGITLTASNIAIFAELDWTPGVVEQAEDRHHRIGQKDTVSVIHLVADESLDARMALRLIEKQRLNDAATRGRDLAGVPAAQGEADPDMPDVAKVTSKVREALERAPNNAVPELPMPMISDEDKRRVRDIARQLLSVCDGARQQDMSGYSKFDRAFGEKVAQSADMSDRMAVAGARMLQRYHRQIGSASADLMRRIAAVQLPAQQRTST